MNSKSVSLTISRCIYAFASDTIPNQAVIASGVLKYVLHAGVEFIAKLFEATL